MKEIFKALQIAAPVLDLALIGLMIFVLYKMHRHALLTDTKTGGGDQFKSQVLKAIFKKKELS